MVYPIQEEKEDDICFNCDEPMYSNDTVEFNGHSLDCIISYEKFYYGEPDDEKCFCCKECLVAWIKFIEENK